MMSLLTPSLRRALPAIAYLMALVACDRGGAGVPVETYYGGLVVSPPSRYLGFPSTVPGEESPPLSFTLKHEGEEPLNLDIGAPELEVYAYVGAQGAGPLTLEPGASARFEVVFAPTEVGSFPDTIVIAHDEIGGEQGLTLALEGEGALETPAPTDSPSPTADVASPTYEETPTFVLPGTPTPVGATPTEGETATDVPQPPSPTPTPLGTPSPTPLPTYEDIDGDGYTQALDCDDADADTYPDAPERCDGLDDDCDGVIDEAFDGDMDGFSTCGGATKGPDCDDADGQVNPAGEEDWDDGVDEDCDGRVTPDAVVVPPAEGGRKGGGEGRTEGVPPGLPTFTSIQAALDASEPGWLIVVFPGTYPGKVSFPSGRALTVLGHGERGAVRIVPDPREGGAGAQSAEGGGALVTLVDALGTLEGVTLENPEGSALEVKGGAPLLRRVEIEDGEGTCLILRRTDARVESLTVSGCRGETGGGILIEGGAPSLSHVEVRESVAALGGGIYVDGARPSFSHVWLRGNTASERGGGIFAQGGSIAWDNGIIEGNEAREAGAGAALLKVGGGLSHVVIRGNGARGAEALLGGGVYLTGVGPTLSHVIIAGNKAQSGAGIYGLGADVVGRQVAISSNSATLMGGGVGLSGGELELTNSIVAFNSATLGYNIHLEGAEVALSATCLFGQWGEGDAGGMVGADLPETAWVGNPGYLNDGTDGVWSDDDYHLKASSEAIDAGDGSSRDPDGSPPDLGPFGGAEAGGFDLDGDGAYQWWDPALGPAPRYDCDDEDPSVAPGQGC